jgi:hypothetical protein
MESMAASNQQRTSKSDTGAHVSLRERLWSLLPIFVPLIIAIVAWWLNEQSKRQAEEYVRKEQNYKSLIANLNGFRADQRDPEKAQRFLDSVNECWLYGPDDVIHAANRLVASMETGVVMADAKRVQLVGDLMVVIRRDLISREPVSDTSLTAKDFRLRFAKE